MRYSAQHAKIFFFWKKVKITNTIFRVTLQTSLFKKPLGKVPKGVRPLTAGCQQLLYKMQLNEKASSYSHPCSSTIKSVFGDSPFNVMLSWFSDFLLQMAKSWDEETGPASPGPGQEILSLYLGYPDTLQTLSDFIKCNTNWMWHCVDQSTAGCSDTRHSTCGMRMRAIWQHALNKNKIRTVCIMNPNLCDLHIQYI